MALSFNQEPGQGTVEDCVESALEAWGSTCNEFYVSDEHFAPGDLVVVHNGRPYRVKLEPI